MQIRDVMVNLLLKQPFYGYLAASVTATECNDIKTVNMLTSPSLKLLYNKEWFETLKDEQAVGVVIHELLHLILLHQFRKGNREKHLWVIACDMAVNEHIDSRLLPDNAITVAKIAKEIKETILRSKSSEFYYDIITNSDSKVSFTENEDEITVVLEGGKELKANDSTDADSSELNKSAFKMAISELMEQANAEGEIPNALNKFITEIYKSYEVDWRNVLKRFLSGRGKTLVRKSCKRESKRFENLPGNKRSVGTNALLALDESGSISDSQVIKFYNELIAIKKITGATLSVTQFDTECTKPLPLEKYTREKERTKNGGTDFRPVFELADNLHIPLLIIFTDGDGEAPLHANQKVLWILTKGGKKPAEYGHSVMLDS